MSTGASGPPGVPNYPQQAPPYGSQSWPPARLRTPASATWAFVLSVLALIAPGLALGVIGAASAAWADPNSGFSDATFNRVVLPIVFLLGASWPLMAVAAIALAIVARRRIKRTPDAVGGSALVLTAFILAGLALGFFLLWLLAGLFFDLVLSG